MPFSTEFYRRRLEQKLESDRGERRPVIHTEAALLAVADDTDFVRDAYRFYLDRNPDLNGLQYFGEMLERLGRLAVLTEIKNSEEGRRLAAMSDGPRPQDVPADAESTGATADAVRMNADPEAAPATAEPPRAAGPTELADLIDIKDPPAFLSAAYLRVLGRAPDADGFAHHLRRLQDGESRELLLHGFASSPEALAPGRVFTWNGQPWRGPSFGARARAAVRRVSLGAGRRTLDARLDDVARVHARVEQGLREQRARQAEIAQAVSDQLAVIERLSQDLAMLAMSMGSASGETAQELQRMRAGQHALRASTEALAARLRQRPDEMSRATVLAGDNVVASLIEGFIVGVPGEEWRLAAYHAFRGVVEPGLTRRFCASLRPGMVVVDVGANIGMYTLHAARVVCSTARGATGEVYSFEPTPRLFTILKDNLQVNGFLATGRVHLRRQAVTDREGTSPFGVHRENNGYNTLFPDDPESQVINVETTTLDAALAGVPRVDVIKIAGEGAEPLIWDGMSDTRQRNPRMQVFMSFAPALLARAGHDPDGFLARVSAAGFAIHRIDEQTGALFAWMHGPSSTTTAATPVKLMLTRSDR